MGCNVREIEKRSRVYRSKSNVKSELDQFQPYIQLNGRFKNESLDHRNVYLLQHFIGVKLMLAPYLLNLEF